MTDLQFTMLAAMILSEPSSYYLQSQQVYFTSITTSLTTEDVRMNLITTMIL